jgi:hypothetical protein
LSKSLYPNTYTEQFFFGGVSANPIEGEVKGGGAKGEKVKKTGERRKKKGK